MLFPHAQAFLRHQLCNWCWQYLPPSNQKRCYINWLWAHHMIITSFHFYWQMNASVPIIERNFYCRYLIFFQFLLNFVIWNSDKLFPWKKIQLIVHSSNTRRFLSKNTSPFYVNTRGFNYISWLPDSSWGGALTVI